jgi:hypothetical protein
MATNKINWGEILPLLAVGAYGAANPTGGTAAFNSYQTIKDRKKQQELEDYQRAIEEENRKRQDQIYNDSRLQMTPELYENLKGSPLQSMFAPKEVNVDNAGALANVGINTPTMQQWGNVAKDDYINVLKTVPQQMTEKDKLELEKLRADIWNIYNPNPTTQKPGQPTQEQISFRNNIASTAGRYKSQKDYLADLSRNRADIINQIGVDGYNSLVTDANNNASSIWNVNKGIKTTKGDVVLTGGQFTPGQSSPMGYLFGKSPKTIIANNQPTNKIELVGPPAPNQNNKAVKTVQLKNKKTGKTTTAYVGLKDGQYYSTENEARLN